MTSNMDEQIDELDKSMHKTMEGVAYRLLGDITTAEDAVHETFAALMFNWDTLSSHPNLRGWLIVALRRVISNEQRKLDSQTVPLDEAYALCAKDAPEPLENLLPSGLSGEDKQILIWRLEEQLSFRDISDLLGITESGCRSRFSRALKRCKELLSGRN